MAPRLMRKVVPSVAVAVGMIAGLIMTAVPATASPQVFSCFWQGISGYRYNCHVSVTGINPGSYMVMHREPNYSGGAIANSPHLTNGYGIQVNCWVSGSGDADGHGDHYWFWSAETVDNASGEHIVAGFVNDWYVTTGSYSHWSHYIAKCPGW